MSLVGWKPLPVQRMHCTSGCQEAHPLPHLNAVDTGGKRPVDCGPPVAGTRRALLQAAGALPAKRSRNVVDAVHNSSGRRRRW